VTTKERLREIVDSLDEAAAARMLLYAEVEMHLPPPLISDERASVLRGLAQAEAGEYVSSDEVFAEYHLD
jgi:hypothetical protein